MVGAVVSETSRIDMIALVYGRFVENTAVIEKQLINVTGSSRKKLKYVGFILPRHWL
jgi:hypothetical protein